MPVNQAVPDAFAMGPRLAMPQAANWYAPMPAPAPVPDYQAQLARRQAEVLQAEGVAPEDVGKLLAKARRVDGWSRFGRSALVSFATTMPTAAAAGVGAVVGTAVGAPLGGFGAIAGAPIGALAGALVAIPFAAPLSTALYALDCEHRKKFPEFTERLPMSRARARGLNAAAYGVGGAVANLPMTAAQVGVAASAAAASVAAGAVIGGLGVAVVPLVSVVGTGVRVAIQESRTKRVPGRVMGLVPQQEPGGLPGFDALLMAQSIRDLQANTTASLVRRDLKRFGVVVARGLPGELRKAVTPGRGLGQTAVNAGLLAVANGISAAANAGLGAGGVPAAAAAATGRVAAVGGAAAWGGARHVHAQPAGRRRTGLSGP